MVRSGRRGLAVAVGLGAAGAVLALVALRQTWLVEVTARPEPFPPERAAHTGGQLRPWLPALAWVALAAAGAVLATGGWARQVVAGILTVAGLGVAVGALAGLGESAWPVLTAAGGLAVAGAGGLALLRGRDWPGLGARYQRTPRRPVEGETAEALWDALDRGEDPTIR